MSETEGSQPLRDRQETFCQLYSQGTYSASEAYRLAGYSKKGADVGSANLLVKESIKSRIVYIKAKRAKKDEVTREILASEYRHAYEVAQGQKSATGMVGATSGRARLYGLDKQVVEQSTPEPMSRTEQQEADEWAEFRLWKASKGRGEIQDGSGPNVVPIAG